MLELWFASRWFKYSAQIITMPTKTDNYRLKNTQIRKVSVVSPVREGLLVPPFSPVSDPRLEWNVGLFSLEPDAAPCRSTQETSAEDNSTVEPSWLLISITSDTHSHFKHYRIILLLMSCSEQRSMTRRVETVSFCHKSLVWTGLEQRNITHTWTLDENRPTMKDLTTNENCRHTQVCTND